MSIALLRAAACVIVTSAALGGPGPGWWELRMDRGERWYPRHVRGALRLEQGAGGWIGSLRFRMILNGQEIALQDLRVKGGDVSFRLAVGGADIELEGKLKRGVLAGTCRWPGCGDFTFTAERPSPIEKRARKDRALPFAAPADTGIAPAGSSGASSPTTRGSR